MSFDENALALRKTNAERAFDITAHVSNYSAEQCTKSVLNKNWTSVQS